MDDSLWSNLDPAEPVVHEAAQSKRPVSDEDAPRQQPMKAGLKPAQRKAPTADQKKHRRQMSKSSGWSDDPEVQAWHKARENVTYTDGSRVQEGDRIRFHQVPGGLLPPGDWRYGEAAYMPGSESKELLLKDDNDGRYYNLYSHVIERAPKKESSMSTQRTEEELLARLATASTMVEQAAIAAQIEDLRATTREHVSVAGSLDWDAMDSAGTSLSHLPSADAHTAAAIAGEHLPAYSVTHDSDWLDDVLPTHVADAPMSATMRAQATGWYTEGVWEPVKADADEFSVQAHNAAVRSSALFGLQRQAAASVFLAQVDHLRTRDGQPKVTRTAEWGTDPYDAPQGDTTNPTYVSDGRDGLPVGVDPSTAETFDEDTLGSGSTSSDPKSSGDTGAAQSLDEGSTPEGDKAVSSENPLTGDTSLDKSTYDTGAPTDRMKTQGAAAPKGTCAICGKPMEQATDGSWMHNPSGTDVDYDDDHEAKPASKQKNSSAHTAKQCPNCGGTGAVPESGGEDPADVDNGYKQCPTCHGTGEVGDSGGWKSESSLQTEADLSDEELRGLVAQQNHLSDEWDKAFADLKAAGVSHDADHPAAAKYRAASDAVNHVNRKLDYYISTGRVDSKPGQPYTVKSSARTDTGQPESSLFATIASAFARDGGIVTHSQPHTAGTPDVNQLMAWEDGSLDPAQEAALFQSLIDSGLAWSLQGMYGRRAMDLINAGVCHPAHTGSAHTADLRPATPEEEEAWLSGYASIPGAQETDAGLLVPEDFHLASRRTADSAPNSTDGLGTGIDEGETPEGDHAESATQDTPSGDLDKSQARPSDNLPTGGEGGGTGVNWDTSDSGAASGPVPGNPPYAASLSGLSANARTFVAALSQMETLDDVVAGVSGHRVAHLLSADPTCPAQVREALKAGGNPFGISPAREAASRHEADSTPPWLRERVNDPYGTPNKAYDKDKGEYYDHPFWTENPPEVVGRYKIINKDGKWYGYDTSQNLWTVGFPDKQSVLDIANSPRLDMWASRHEAAESDTCPRCGAHMSDVTVSGDTLRAKCGNCGWTGTKKKSSVEAAAPTKENYDRAGQDASLGVGHIWTNTACPAYTTLDPKDCTCGGRSATLREAARDTGTCAECGAWISYDKDSRKWTHDSGDDPHQARPAKAAAKQAADGLPEGIVTDICATCGAPILGAPATGKWAHDPRYPMPSHPDGSVAGDAHAVRPLGKSASLSFDMSTIAANLSTVAARFEVKKDAVHPYHGVWDTKDGSWHEGDYDNATYAAGVPMWSKREDAQSVVDRLNAN